MVRGALKSVYPRLGYSNSSKRHPLPSPIPPAGEGLKQALSIPSGAKFELLPVTSPAGGRGGRSVAATGEGGTSEAPSRDAS